MSSEWTKEERVVCALSREEPDRVPLYDLVSSVAFIEHFARQALTLENASEVVPLAMSRSLDTTRVFLPGALGRRRDRRGFVYERRDWFNEWQVETPFHNMESLADYVGGEIERLSAWKPDDPEGARSELLEWKRYYAGTVIPASWAGEAMQDNYIEVGLDWFTWLDSERPELVQEWIAARHAQLMRRLQSEVGCCEVSPLAWILWGRGIQRAPDFFAEVPARARLLPQYYRNLRPVPQLPTEGDLPFGRLHHADRA